MFNDRLKDLRLSKGYNMRQMAAALNLPYMTYVHYEKNEREPNSETLVLMAKYFDVTVDYLLGKSTHPTSDITAIERYSELYPIETKKVPLLGAIACGKPIFSEMTDCYVNAAADLNADFCLICRGDSMINARIFDGDVVFIKEMPIVENGQIAAVAIDNEVTLKRVYYYPEQNKIVLSPENSKYEPFVYLNEELNDVKILGKAVAFTSIIK